MKEHISKYEIRSYFYKSPIINMILSVVILFCSCFFIRMVSFDGVAVWIKIICTFFFILFLLFGIFLGYIYTKNIKSKQIIIKEDKIMIPSPFGDSYCTFYYSKINILRIMNDNNAIYSPYGGSMYIASQRRNFVKEVFIGRLWMKNKKEYLELFEFLKEKTSSNQMVQLKHPHDLVFSKKNENL